MIHKLENILNKKNDFGNKAKNLSILANQGILVPRGIAINFDDYFEYLDLKKFSQKFREELSKSLRDIPEPYAVRSSADVEDSNRKSYAGQFTTKLYVSTKDIFNAILEIYDFAKRFNGGYRSCEIKMGVVVQQMIDSDFSGVLFTYDIINQNTDSWVIELANGMCENVVSGKTNPSLYIINKNSKEIVLFEEGNQNVVLTNKQISQILDNASRIERIFERPQDIEFLFHLNKFYCLQSRDITTI